jgi:drug/metabolite transporter (DMT)-like permease
VLSTVLAIPILGERPGLIRVAGGAVTLVGVYLVLRESRPNPPAPFPRREGGVPAGRG